MFYSNSGEQAFGRTGVRFARAERTGVRSASPDDSRQRCQRVTMFTPAMLSRSCLTRSCLSLARVRYICLLSCSLADTRSCLTLARVSHSLAVFHFVTYVCCRVHMMTATPIAPRCANGTTVPIGSLACHKHLPLPRYLAIPLPGTAREAMSARQLRRARVESRRSSADEANCQR